MLVRWSVGHGWMDVLSQTPWEVPAVQGLLLGHGDHRRNRQVIVVSPDSNRFTRCFALRKWLELSCVEAFFYLLPKKTPIFGVTMTWVLYSQWPAIWKKRNFSTWRNSTFRGCKMQPEKNSPGFQLHPVCGFKPANAVKRWRFPMGKSAWKSSIVGGHFWPPQKVVWPGETADWLQELSVKSWRFF